MRSKDGFAGSLVMTTDDDWQAKWNTPQDTKPSFNRAETVPYGKKVYALILFANPQLDGGGLADVKCDLTLTDPRGKAVLSEKNRKCFVGRLKGNPANLYLAEPVVGFSGDPGDPPGTWVFDVALRDVTRGVELPLRAAFALQQGAR